MDSGGDRTRARKLAEEARAVWQRCGDPCRTDLAAVTKWPKMEGVLQGLLRNAQTGRLQIAVDEFLSWVGASLSAQVNDCAALSGLRVGDLLLVYGFNQEDPIATKVIERRYLPHVEQSLRSYALSDLDVAEIEQTLRQRLWSGPRVSSNANAQEPDATERLGRRRSG